MRKILGFLVLFVFVGCSSFLNGDHSIKSLSFNFNDGPISPAYYSEAVLALVPDYEMRTLQLDYFINYPYRTAETEGEDFEAQGIVGGEFFDRFEEAVEVLAGGDLGNCPEITVGGYNFDVDVENSESEIININLRPCKEDDDGEYIKNLYNDLIDLLHEDVY